LADETPQEREALAKLDEATREVGWDEQHNEGERRLKRSFGVPLLWNLPGLPRFRKIKGDPVPEPVDDADPKDERGLRDVHPDR
jgi:hypothetical protein